MKRITAGFTLVEIMIAISIIAILASISVLAYNGAQQRGAMAAVQSDAEQATTLLNGYRTEKHSYPPNLADTDFAASPDVAVTFYTNAPQTPQYPNLSPDENAQLFLNTCNGVMPVVSGGTTYNTSCTFAGINIHVNGTKSSNIVWHGKEIYQSEVVLTCGSACDAAATQMINLFLSQGGTFPIVVPKGQVPLPAPTLVTTGNASVFCLESRSGNYPDVIYHTSSESSSVVEGPCPDNPELHYP